MDIMALCDLVRQTGFELHRYLGGGMLEAVYEAGLAHRLRQKGIQVGCQYALQVMDEDGTVLGNYEADLFIEQSLIVEIKACRAIVEEHIAQILGYMRAARMEHGLIVNFGPAKFEIRKFIWTPR